VFTKNGKFLGTVFKGVWEKHFPSVEMMSRGAMVRVNFGPDGFEWNGEMVEQVDEKDEKDVKDEVY
jgi:hypothetical protein